MEPMRQWLCDICEEAHTRHETTVRGVLESICDECLAPPGWGSGPRWWHASLRQAGLARARAFLRKQQYWREEEIDGPESV